MDGYDVLGDDELTFEDELLGKTAWLLHERGHRSDAALLLDVMHFRVEWGGGVWDSWEGAESSAVIEVEPHMVARFDEMAQTRIRDTLQEVAGRGGTRLGPLVVRAKHPTVSADWRERLAAAIADDSPKNQARNLRIVKPQHTEDGLAFTNDAELRVYQALRRAQERLGPAEGIAIFPLPSGRVLPSHTWEPDFLVTYKKKTGLIEVDGPQHGRRYAADASRDAIWRDAGVAHIDRIVPEDTRDAASLDAFVDRFLRQLERS